MAVVQSLFIVPPRVRTGLTTTSNVYPYLANADWLHRITSTSAPCSIWLARAHLYEVRYSYDVHIALHVLEGRKSWASLSCHPMPAQLSNGDIAPSGFGAQSTSTNSSEIPDRDDDSDPLLTTMGAEEQ